MKPPDNVFELIGAGVSSSAYLMQDKVSVLKVYKDKSSFCRERDLLNALKGPDSIPWLRVQKKNKQDGKVNTMVLQPRGEPLSAENISKTLIRDYLTAIRYLHGMGYVHNDLRLPNLLVCQHGDPAVTRGLLIDFGFAEKQGEPAAGGTERARESPHSTFEGDLADFIEAMNEILADKSPTVKKLYLSAYDAAKKLNYDDVETVLLKIYDAVTRHAQQ